jgi:hypothetical protein
VIDEPTSLRVLQELGDLRDGEGWAVTSGWMTVWARMVPRILLAARPGLGRTAHDRTYTAAELHAVSGDEDGPCWRVVRQLIDHPRYWRWLLRWALDVLYPQYRERFGREHACQIRVEHLDVLDRMVTARHNNSRRHA